MADAVLITQEDFVKASAKVVEDYAIELEKAGALPDLQKSVMIVGANITAALKILLFEERRKMVSREKIIKGLECCSLGNCQECTYFCTGDCLTTLLKNAMTLLKESTDQKRGHWIKMTGMMPPEFTGHFECDNCGWHGKLNERETDYNFCPGCGARMSIGFPGFDGDDCKSTPLDEILADYLKKMDNENEKEK